MNPFKTVILLLCTFLPSPLRLAIWRRLGFTVAPHCRVSMFSLVVAQHIDLGWGAIIEPLTFICCPKRLVMGERSRIAGFVRIIGYGQVILGSQTLLALGCLVDCSTEFRVGRRSQIGPRGTYYTHGATPLTFNMRYPQRVGPIRIGEDCWLGMGCIVYPHTTIGDRIFVGPGTVVRENLSSDRAVLPPEKPYRIVPITFLKASVDDAVQLEKIEELLRQCGEAHRGSTLDATRDDCWVLSLPRRGRVVLLRRPATWNWKEFGQDTTVVWRFDSDVALPPFPTFDFRTLRILGDWTPFAESVAALLCGRCGTHFVFDRTPAQDR